MNQRVSKVVGIVCAAVALSACHELEVVDGRISADATAAVQAYLGEYQEVKGAGQVDVAVVDQAVVLEGLETILANRGAAGTVGKLLKATLSPDYKSADLVFEYQPAELHSAIEGRKISVKVNTNANWGRETELSYKLYVTKKRALRNRGKGNRWVWVNTYLTGKLSRPNV